MKRLKKILPTIAILALILLVWHLAVQSGRISSYVLPSPSRVFSTFLRMLKSGDLIQDILISLGRVARGFGIAFLLAFCLASLCYLFPRSEPFYQYLVHFFRHVPPLAMIPLLILWCGIGETTKTVIIVLATFFPMYLAILKGFRSCNPTLMEAAKSLSAGQFRIFIRIVLPMAVPDILLGVRTGLGYAWRAIIGAEMVAASTGLGHLILFSQQMSRTDRVIVGILVIGITGCLTDSLLGYLIHRLIPNTDDESWS